MDNNRSKKFSKNRRPTKRTSATSETSKREKFSKEDYKGTKPNDPSWYMGKNRLAQNVASLSFGAPIGKPLALKSHSSGFTSNSITTPGVMSLLYTPGPGLASEPNSPVNIAADNIYTYMRTVFSGTRPYDPPDLMMYLLALDSAYSFLSWMTRLYGTIRTYSSINRYVGKACIYAMGGDFDNLVRNLALLRTYINLYTTKLSVFCAPATMPIYRRHWFMNSGIYKDCNLDKAQYYIFNPAYLYKWDEGIGDGTRLVPFGVCCNSTLNTDGSMPAKTNTYEMIVQMGNDIINALYRSEDVATISGDIMKSYKDSLFTLTLLSEDYVVLPEYSEEMALEIHNLTPVGNRPVLLSTNGFVPDINTLIISQVPDVNTGMVHFRPTFGTAPCTCYDPIVDCFSNDPTAEEVMVATRFKVWGNQITSGSTKAYDFEAFGSELFHYARVCYFRPGANFDTLAAFVAFGDGHSDAAGDIQHAIVEKFRGRPLIPIVNSSVTQASQLCGDIHNFTTLDERQLIDIHTVAMCNLFGIPYLGVTEA